jgi:DNA-binding transcriptional MerR regulator
VSGFRLRARLGFSIPSTFSGPRGITPAFGYGAPHSSARGTSTLLSNALLSAHYEQVGLMPTPSRTEGNYRVYETGHVRRLKFIRRLRVLGFTLDQVRDLLRLSSEKNQACGEVDRITQRHLTEVEDKIRDLRKLASELQRLSQCCQGKGRIADCRIIEALAS